MSKYWIKLYHEILDDPKMGRLSEHLYKRTIELFLMAGEYDEDGALPPVDDMAWRLRSDVDVLQTDLNELQCCQIVTLVDGLWIVTKFAERQRPATESERVARYRERKRKSELIVTNSDKNVTTSLQKAVPDIDIDIDKDTDKEEDKVLNAATAAPPQPLTEGQRFVMDAFGAKRFRTNIQRDAVSEAETIYGIEKLREYTKWAATKGFTLGDAVSKMDLTLKKWGKPKPIPHQSTDAIDDAWREAQGNG